MLVPGPNRAFQESAIYSGIGQFGEMEEQEVFDPKDYVKAGVTLRDVEIYKEIYDLFGGEANGCLTPSDIRNALKNFNYHPKKHLIYQIISDVDADESGGIDFTEFIKIMTGQKRPYVEDTTDDYDRVFTYFDMENKGKSSYFP